MMQYFYSLKQRYYMNTLNFDSKTQRFHNLYPIKIPKMTLKQSLRAVQEILYKSALKIPTSKIPQIKPNLEVFEKASDKLKFIWFGHSTVLLNIDGIKVLIDPMFSMYASSIKGIIKRFQPPVLMLKELPYIDVIVISHDHYDHLDKKSIRFFKDKETRFLVPLGIKRYLMKWGISEQKIVELDWHESYQMDSIHFTATPAHHFSGRNLLGHNKTLWASWVIKGKNANVFFSGDSAYSPHFKEIGERYGAFDVAFMENGQYDKRWLNAHMMPEQTTQAIKDIQAKIFVPIHWSMFRLSPHHWLDPMVQSLKITKAQNVPMLHPLLGEIMSIPLP